MNVHRRALVRMLAGGALGASVANRGRASSSLSAHPPLTITGLKVTPIALPDPPLLNVGGCHEYYEDPVSGHAAMAEVRRATGLKMSTNMCVTSYAHIPEALNLKPIDVLLCDHHYFGGFAGCLALRPICTAAGWAMSQHSNNYAGVTMAAMIHLAASIPELTLASDTHNPWLIEGTDIIEGPRLTIRNGRMAVPSGPGLGITLDADRLANARETYRKCGMRGRDDRSLMRRIEPGWTGAPL